MARGMAAPARSVLRSFVKHFRSNMYNAAMAAPLGLRAARKLASPYAYRNTIARTDKRIIVKPHAVWQRDPRRDNSSGKMEASIWVGGFAWLAA